jgi:hypothetical protein
MIADKFLLYGAALALAVGGTFLVAQTVRVGQLRAELTATKLALETERRMAADAAKTALEQYRAAEQRLITHTQTEVRNAQTSSRAADAAAAHAVTAAAGLRQRLAAVAARCGRAAEAPAAAAGSASAAEAGHLLADVSGRLEAAGRELAEFAERSAIAGQACERIAEMTH